MKKLFIFGTGVVAEVAHYHFSQDGEYEIKAFVDFRKYIKKKKKFGIDTVAFEKIEKYLPKKDCYGFVALGYKELNAVRKKVYGLLKRKKYKLVSYISKKNSISKNVKIGDNCFILENQIIHPFTSIGNNVTLWSGNIIGHHCKIEDHCFITSGVVVGGNSKIGEGSFIGLNSSIKDGLKIGKNCAILMASAISRNMSNESSSISKISDIFEKENKSMMLIKKKYFNIK